MKLCTNPLHYSHSKSFNDIKFLLPNLVAFSCYTINIHLEKLLIRCDTKRAIWWYWYNKRTSIFCIKPMSTIFRTLQANKSLSKNKTFFSSCKTNATKFGTKTEIYTKLYMTIWLLMGKLSWLYLIHVWFYFIWIVSCSWGNYTILLLLLVAEKVLLLLVISLTADVSLNKNAGSREAMKKQRLRLDHRRSN